MSNAHNERLKEHLEMQVISSNFSAQDLLEELGMTYKSAYEDKLSHDDLILLVVQKRFEESPEVE